METAEKGTQIEVTDAMGEVRLKRVLAPTEGGKFPAVWACTDEEWSAALSEGREPEPEPFPWPLQSARPIIHV
jgi:hypothetical protein